MIRHKLDGEIIPKFVDPSPKMYSHKKDIGKEEKRAKILKNAYWKEKSNKKTSKNCYSGHNFLAPCEKFKPNLTLYSKHSIFFCGKIKINCYSIFIYLYLTHFSTFTHLVYNLISLRLF